MRDIPAKRARILQTATELFAANGFEGTTLVMVATKSGAAVGSVVHFFIDKAKLAVAVREQAIERLTMAIDLALTTGPRDVTISVRMAVSAYLTWATKYPADVRVLQELRLVAAATPSRQRQLAIYEPLLEILEKWTIPLIEAGTLPPISRNDLYAVVLAPAEFAAVAGLEDGQRLADRLDDLSIILSAAACAGLSRSRMTTDAVPAKPLDVEAMKVVHPG